MKTLETRARIIQAAIELLRVSNPLGVRPVDLSLYTGVSPSLINYHFPDPATIISTAAAAALLKQARLERSWLDDLTKDASSAIESWLEIRRTWAKANPGIVAVLVSPNVFKLNELPEWVEAERLVRDGLAVHISVRQQGSAQDARKMSEFLLRLAFIAPGEIKPEIKENRLQLVLE